MARYRVLSDKSQRIGMRPEAIASGRYVCFKHFGAEVSAWLARAQQ